MTVAQPTDMRTKTPVQEKKALVTGIAGFCGSHLGESLLDAAQRVIGIEMPSANASNIRPILDQIELRRADVREPGQLHRILVDIQPDRIYHLAGLTGQGRKSELRTLYEVNLQGTLNLLEAVAALGLNCPILIAGSSAQYGRVAPDEKPVGETQAFRPVTHYAVSKAAQDLLGFCYWAAMGLRVIRARTFNIIGPRQSPQFVASAFSEQIAEIEIGQRAPTLFVGNLKAARDFIDVRDVVRAYQLLVEKGEPGEAYNVCSGEAHSIRSLLDQLLALSTVQEIEIREDPARIQEADIPVQIGDYGKLFCQTGWKPMIPLEQSLRDMLDYWRTRVREES